MNKENCALKLVDEIILYYDAWSKKHQILKSVYDYILKINFLSLTLYVVFVFSIVPRL